MTGEPIWEKWALRILLGLFVIIEVNGIHNLAYIGQDYSLHVMCTEHLMRDPSQWFTFDFTNRPMPYWIGAACHWFTHGRMAYDLASLIFVGLNALALYLLHDGTRRFISSPLLRVAAVTFVALLPSTLVTSTVFAADAVAQLPFVFTVWCLLRCANARTVGASTSYAALAGATLCVGNLTKFTFLFLPAAVTAIAGLLWWWKRTTLRQALIIIGLAAVVPMIASCWIYRAAQRDVAHEEPRHTFDWKGTGEMTWSSVLLVKSRDNRIFDAPGYWDPPANPGAGLPLLASNSYSYPALLHLAIFTDVLDYANQGGTDNGTPRPELQKKFSRFAVRFGLLFSVSAFLAMAAFIGRTAFAIFRPSVAPSTGAVVWGIMALTWYAPLVAVLPYLHNSYEWGYWLPRLILPALWGFALILFSTAERVFAGRRNAAYVIAALVLFQAVVGVRSIWY